MRMGKAKQKKYRQKGNTESKHRTPDQIAIGYGKKFYKRSAVNSYCRCRATSIKPKVKKKIPATQNHAHKEETHRTETGREKKTLLPMEFLNWCALTCRSLTPEKLASERKQTSLRQQQRQRHQHHQQQQQQQHNINNHFRTTTTML